MSLGNHVAVLVTFLIAMPPQTQRIKALTLFVTHYPELSTIAELLPDAVANCHM